MSAALSDGHMNFTELNVAYPGMYSQAMVSRFSFHMPMKGVMLYEFALMNLYMKQDTTILSQYNCMDMAAPAVNVDWRHWGWKAAMLLMASADTNMNYVLEPAEINNRWMTMDDNMRMAIKDATGNATVDSLSAVIGNIGSVMFGHGINDDMMKPMDIAKIAIELFAPPMYIRDVRPALTVEMIGPLCLPADVFMQMDENKDGFLMADEFAMFIEATSMDPCDGFVEVKDKMMTIKADIPLMPRKCSWLVNPQWFYAPPMDMNFSGAAATTFGIKPAYQVTTSRVTSGTSRYGQGRRSEEESADEKLVAREAQMASRGAHRRLLSVLPTATVEDVEHSSSRRATIPVLSYGYNFTVTLYRSSPLSGTSPIKVCSGVLISPKHVLTTSSCVRMAVSQGSPIVTASIGAITGDYFQARAHGVNDVIDVVQVANHPAYSVDYTSDVAILTLATESSKTPIEMYDGSDVGFTDCRKMMLRQLSNYGNGLVEDNATLVPQEECLARHHWYYGSDGMIGADTMCVEGGFGPCNSMVMGDPLFAITPKGVPVLLGIFGDTSMCNAGLPSVYVRVSTVLPWITSAMNTSVHPAEKLVVTVKSLAMPLMGKLQIFKGSRESSTMVKSTLDSTCQAGAVVDDDGEGSMLIVYTPGNATRDVNCGSECYASMGFEIQVETLGCEDNFERFGMVGNMSQYMSQCSNTTFGGMNDARGGITGCMYRPPMNGKPPMCMSPMCLMTQRWQELGPMEVAGSAFAGGLGQRMVKNASHEYGVWTCLRDWDEEEQLMCGVRPHELGCFWFEEKTREWAYQGVNQETRLVENAKYGGGLDKEEAKVAKHIILPNPRKLDLDYLML